MKARMIQVAFTLALALPTLPATPVSAQRVPTFTEDVAPILFESCARCHQPDGIGPMSLLNYDDARKFAMKVLSMQTVTEIERFVSRDYQKHFATEPRQSKRQKP